MALDVAYPTQLYTLSSSYPKKPPEGPLQVPLQLSFTPEAGASGITGYIVNLANAGGQQGSGFSQLCTVFVDNSQSPGTTVIQAVGSNLSVAVPPYARGYYPIQAPNLNIKITNNSTSNSVVYVGCFNYVVNPQSDTLVPSVLGDMDAQVLQRAGNTASCGQFVNISSGITPLGGFAVSSAEYPYYYLTGFDVSWVGSGGAGSTFANLVDYNSSSQITNTFATFMLFSAQTTQIMPLNRSGILLSGGGTLGLSLGASILGTLAINWYGGRSATAITAAEFAPVT